MLSVCPWALISSTLIKHCLKKIGRRGQRKGGGGTREGREDTKEGTGENRVE